MDDLTDLRDSLARTALVPFWARAADAGTADSILSDFWAAAIAPSVAREVGRVPISRSTGIGCCLRDRLIDTWVSEQCSRSAPTTVVDLGVGLNTRRERLSLNGTTYVEVDHPEIMTLRDRLLPSAQPVRIGADALDVDCWADAITKSSDQRVVLVLQGVLFYHTSDRVTRFFRRLSETLPRAVMIFDSVSRLGRRNSNRPANREGGRPEYRWAVGSPGRLHIGGQRLTILDERGFMDLDPDLTRGFGRSHRLLYTLPPLRRAYRITLGQLP